MRVNWSIQNKYGNPVRLQDSEVARWLKGSQPAVRGPIERREERAVQAEHKGGNRVGKGRISKVGVARLLREEEMVVGKRERARSETKLIYTN